METDVPRSRERPIFLFIRPSFVCLTSSLICTVLARILRASMTSLLLIRQFCNARKFQFISDSFNEIYPYLAAVYVAIEVQDVNFNRKEVIVEGRAVADVGDTVERFGAAFGCNGINARLRHDSSCRLMLAVGHPNNLPPLLRPVATVPLTW